MKTALLLALCLVTLGANAGAAAKNKKQDCSDCAAVQKLTKETRQLKYANDKDKFKGGEKAMAAVGYLEKFTKLSAKDAQREKLFTELLELSREVSLYDGESQVQQMLAEILKDAKLKKTFDGFLKTAAKDGSKAEACKSEHLEKTVGAIICMDRQGLSGKELTSEEQIKKADECTSKFIYEECLSKK